MVNIELDNKIRLQKKKLPEAVLKEITDRLTLKNPTFAENQKYNRWNGRTSEFLYYFENTRESLILPRGFTGQLLRLLKSYGTEYTLIDQTRRLPEVNFSFDGTLHDFQQDAVNSVLKKRFGVLQAPTGSGKTVMAYFSKLADRSGADYTQRGGQKGRAVYQ